MNSCPTSFYKFTDDMGRQVAIPATPLRIASLHDISITIPLIELGVFPVGSHGRTTDDGSLYVERSYGNLGKVLRDAGFKFPKIVDDIKDGGDATFSAEKLQDLDADYIFVTYRTDQLQTPQDSVEGLEKVIPDSCDYLTACKEGCMLVLPREAATTSSFDALSITASNVLTHISGNPFAKK
ncbi:MAG: ABC transporter substrate-binding protein [Alphaproteobacteria bacterium]|nr:ABC transporter substrate-binding protein [Alphaproteobacteria bacterium]